MQTTVSMEIGMLNFWLGLLVTALTQENYFNLKLIYNLEYAVRYVFS